MENKALHLINSMIDEAYESCDMDKAEVLNAVINMISAVVNKFLEEESND